MYICITYIICIVYTCLFTLYFIVIINFLLCIYIIYIYIYIIYIIYCYIVHSCSLKLKTLNKLTIGIHIIIYYVPTLNMTIYLHVSTKIDFLVFVQMIFFYPNSKKSSLNFEQKIIIHKS